MSEKDRKRNKTEEGQIHSDLGESQYTVVIDIDENARRVEGRVEGEMPEENIPLMISDFIMQTAMMEIGLDGPACPYDMMDRISEMVTYIAGGFAAIAGVRSTCGKVKAVKFINGTFQDFRKDAHTQIVFTPYEDEEFGTQYHVDVYGTPVFSPWKALLALAEIADARMSRTKGLSLPSVLIACNAPSIISSVMDEIVFDSFGCDGICDECPVSGDDDGCDDHDEDHDEDDTGFVFGGPQDMPC